MLVDTLSGVKNAPEFSRTSGASNARVPSRLLCLCDCLAVMAPTESIQN